jgi:hypothetical protein
LGIGAENTCGVAPGLDCVWWSPTAVGSVLKTCPAEGLPAWAASTCCPTDASLRAEPGARATATAASCSRISCPRGSALGMMTLSGFGPAADLDCVCASATGSGGEGGGALS